MEDNENTSQSASKRRKSDEAAAEEDEVGADEQKTSSDSLSNSTNNNNDSGLVTTADLGTSVSSDLQELSPNTIKVGDSGFDIAGNVTAEESPPSCSMANQGGGGDDVPVNNSKTNKDETEATSVKNCQNRSQKNSKSNFFRNRLTCISSSSDDDGDDNAAGREFVIAVSPPVARTATESGVDISVEENPEHIAPVASESIPSTEPRDENQAEDAIAEASGPRPLPENSSATNRANRRTLRRGRGNRATGRNYRIRWASSSSSSDEERPAVVMPDDVARASSPDDAELPSNDNDPSESSDNVSSVDSTESDSQNILPRNFYMDSSSDTDSNTDDPMNDSMNEEANVDQSDDLQDVLNKPKPTYTWNSTYELMRREHGLTGNGRYSLQNGMSPGFNTRFYSSRHVVERMKLLHCLRKHTGCVNCLNFNRSGNLLCTGSDDMRVVIWDWAQNKVKHSYKSGHTENIFQTKFIESGSGTGLDIVSAGRDGQVRRAIVPPSGAKASTTCLYKHKDSVHKLVLCPQNPTEIISVGEDGYVKHYDLRKSGSDVLKVVKANNRKVRLFSISHHPFNPEICVCGCDRYVRVYDKRNMSKTVHEMCPQPLLDTSIPQVTCSVYNSTGSEILSSYGDDHIYLFNNKVYNKGEYLHRYRGHYNHKTIKGVNFFGPNSEYVISGSDCSNIFFWDKNTEAILNFMPGDTMGVVNCLEPHPSIPTLATSGLDHNIKIWAPNSEIYPPDLSKLGDRVKRNLRRSVIEEANDIDDHQFQYFMRQFIRQPRGRLSNRGSRSQNVPESQTSSSSSSGDDYPTLEAIHCRTQ